MCDIGQANSLPCSESEQSVSEANWLSESSVARLAAWVSVRKCLESVEPSLDSDGFSAGWGEGEDGAICRPTLLRSDEWKGRRCVQRESSVRRRTFFSFSNQVRGWGGGGAHDLSLIHI